MTTTAGTDRGPAWPPVFPYSLAGAVSDCKCSWWWDYDRGLFVKLAGREQCTWCVMWKAAMGRPASEADQPETTTIQVSRGQRAEISDIQAELVLERGRHVTTKETLSELINFWKEHHRGHTQKG